MSKRNRTNWTKSSSTMSKRSAANYAIEIVNDDDDDDDGRSGDSHESEVKSSFRRQKRRFDDQEKQRNLASDIRPFDEKKSQDQRWKSSALEYFEERFRDMKPRRTDMARQMLEQQQQQQRYNDEKKGSGVNYETIESTAPLSPPPSQAIAPLRLEKTLKRQQQQQHDFQQQQDSLQSSVQMAGMAISPSLPSPPSCAQAENELLAQWFNVESNWKKTLSDRRSIGNTAGFVGNILTLHRPSMLNLASSMTNNSALRNCWAMIAYVDVDKCIEHFKLTTPRQVYEIHHIAANLRRELITLYDYAQRIGVNINVSSDVIKDARKLLRVDEQKLKALKEELDKLCDSSDDEEDCQQRAAKLRAVNGETAAVRRTDDGATARIDSKNDDLQNADAAQDNDTLEPWGIVIPQDAETRQLGLLELIIGLDRAIFELMRCVTICSSGKNICQDSSNADSFASVNGFINQQVSNYLRERISLRFTNFKQRLHKLQGCFLVSLEEVDSSGNLKFPIWQDRSHLLPKIAKEYVLHDLFDMSDKDVPVFLNVSRRQRIDHFDLLTKRKSRSSTSSTSSYADVKAVGESSNSDVLGLVELAHVEYKMNKENTKGNILLKGYVSCTISFTSGPAFAPDK